MAPSAGRITPRLLREVARIDDGKMPIAEVNRRLGRAAEELGLLRPSYERVRVLVHELRLSTRKTDPSITDVLVDIAYLGRSPLALLDHALRLEDSHLPPSPERRSRK